MMAIVAGMLSMAEMKSERLFPSSRRWRRICWKVASFRVRGIQSMGRGGWLKAPQPKSN